MGNRRLSRIVPGSRNSMRYLWEHRNFLVVCFNLIVIEIAKYVPFLGFKNDLLRLTRMKIGKDASIGLCAMFDIFYPELIEIGENTIIGYNATIIAHEYLVAEMRTGKVVIGKNCMIGANSTVLAGVEIGDSSTVSAGTVVDSDIPPNSFARGNPMVVRSKGGVGK
ncbi:acyltransferase [Candidatus Micrarchaeota archaeon]|nr:acyltransferase [Candidatus Micrarchaeota archaeon]